MVNSKHLVKRGFSIALTVLGKSNITTIQDLLFELSLILEGFVMGFQAELKRLGCF